MGGRPFPDGEDHGGADDEFASVVLDESFVRAASFHEASARDRALAAARARAAAEAARALVGADEPDDFPSGVGAGPYDDTDLGLYGGEHRRGYGAHTRWHRTVAWLLALIMGLGVVALTFAAVYRGAGGASRHPAPAPPPATGRIDLPRSPVQLPSPAVH